jgi:hypothetical protein
MSKTLGVEFSESELALLRYALARALETHDGRTSAGKALAALYRKIPAAISGVGGESSDAPADVCPCPELTTVRTHVVTLRRGETPWAYRHTPGVIPGPFSSIEDARATLEAQGLSVGTHWECEGGDGPDTLWVECWNPHVWTPEGA